MRTTAVLTTFTLALAANAQNTTAAFAELTERRLRADLTFLTSTPLNGRLSLERGSDVAIHWIASEFAKAGLKAPVEGYLQPAPLVEFRADTEKSYVTLRFNGETRKLQTAAAFPVNKTIQGDIVFAGFGISAPELGYDDYAGIDVKGKIVLIFDHEPQEDNARSIFSGKGNTRYAGTYVKVRTAQQKGAAAVLLIPEPNRKHPSNEERRNRIAGAATRRTRIASQTLEDSELTIPLVNLTEAAGKDLIAATSGGPTAADLHTAIDRELKPQSRALKGASAEIVIVNADTRHAISHNVLGLLEGSDPKLKNEVIVISAHHDHDGPAFNLGPMFPGADDNGSGTVGVVALAHAFMKSGVKPKRSILFAVFAAEERGLLGAYHYVNHPVLPLDGTRAVINFDMIGRNEAPSTQTDGLIEIAKDTSNEMNLIGAYYSPDYRAVVEKANKEAGLKLNYKWDEEAALNVFFRSDQYPFVLKGHPGDVVVHRLSSGLPPGDRHRRPHQFHEDGEDPAARLHVRDRLRQHLSAAEVRGHRRAATVAIRAGRTRWRPRH
jgi:hypothetical protein